MNQSLAWHDGEAVSLAHRGSAPDIGAFECEGDCTPAAIQPLPDERVRTGLQALYTFANGGGILARDVSGVGTPLDLEIQEPDGVRWAEDSIAIVAPALLASSEPATKITAACQSSDELTVEAWISPDETEPDSPARIVALLSAAGDQYFALTFEPSGDDPRGVYGFHLRTSEQPEDGELSLFSLRGAARSLPTQVVFTRESSGFSRLHVNRELQAAEMDGGALSNWNEATRLVVGNEATGGHPWLGRLYLLALYCRALDSAEIRQNYAVGLREIYQTPY